VDNINIVRHSTSVYIVAAVPIIYIPAVRYAQINISVLFHTILYHRAFVIDTQNILRYNNIITYAQSVPIILYCAWHLGITCARQFTTFYNIGRTTIAAVAPNSEFFCEAKSKIFTHHPPHLVWRLNSRSEVITPHIMIYYEFNANVYLYIFTQAIIKKKTLADVRKTLLVKFPRVIPLIRIVLLVYTYEQDNLLLIVVYRWVWHHI